MVHAQVIMAGAPSIKAHMALVFETTQALLDGGRIELRAPEVYKFSCREVEGYSPLMLPNVQACDDAGIFVQIVLNGTLTPGRYAYTLGVTCPAYTPTENLFSLLLLDSTLTVVDARMKFEGPRIVQGLYLRPLVLDYTSAKPLQQATIQVSMEFHTELDPASPIGEIRAVQIAVPERFTLITRMGVENLDGLPTPESGWHHLFFAERLVRIDLVRNLGEQVRVIPAGLYRLRFQVRLPEFWMPNVNVWLLSLCRDLRCTDLVSTAPVAGFNLNEEATLTIEGGDGETETQEGAASRRHHRPGSAWLPLAGAWLLLLLLGRPLQS